MRPNTNTVERNRLFLNTLNEIDPDIIILTETNAVIDFGDKYFSVSTTPLPGSFEGYNYKSGENRATILSKYPFVRQFPTADHFTSVCAEVDTPFGQLIIYGTIIGFLGGLLHPFQNDLQKQTTDLVELVKQGNVCFAGDLNISFAGRPYPGKRVVNQVSELFDNLALMNLTKNYENSALHAVISYSFIENKLVKTERVFFTKDMSDHSLVTLTLTPDT